MAVSSVAMDPSTEATGVSRARSLFLNVGFVLALLLGWQAIVEAEWVPRYLFPGPIAVASSLLEMLRDGTMIESLRLSLGRMFIGYGLSVVGGIAIGLLVARNWVFKHTFGAVILSLQSLPSICWLPIALIWVGLNERAVVVVVVLGAIFSIAVATENAVRNIAPIHLKVGRVMGARGWSLRATFCFSPRSPSSSAA
ncbi:MAG: ABC transporter permease subunit [bacterium]